MVLHLFYECPFTNFFLKKIEDFCFALSNEQEEPLQQDVFIGKLGKNDLLNNLIIVAKLRILPKGQVLGFLKRWLISNINLRNT